MKKIIIIACMLVAGITGTFSVSAQSGSNTSLVYTFGVPFGSLDEHAGNWSGRGVNLEYQKEVSPSLSVGFNIGYSVFCGQKPKDTYTQGNMSITGVKYTYDNIVPILVTANHTFGSHAIGPYVGLGVGTLYDLRNTNMGLYTIEEHNWHFDLAPQAGFIFDTGAPVSLKLAFKYDHAFKIQNSDGFGMFTMSIGVVFVKM